MATKGQYTYDYPRPALTADCVIFGRCEVKGSDDARDARWYPLSAIPPLAFDPAQILSDALQKLKEHGLPIDPVLTRGCYRG